MIMDDTFLHQQETGKPAFSDVIWSRPQSRHNAGKLALVGGSSQGFNSVSEAYAAANRAGIGIIRTLMPDSLQKLMSALLPESEFAPSTKTGSLSSKALNDLLGIENWADAVLFCGDLGHNSETAILLENYLEKSHSSVTLAGDSVAVAMGFPTQLLANDRLIVALDFAQLQRFISSIRFPTAANSRMTLFQMADLMHSLTQSYPLAVIPSHEGFIFVAFEGKVSTTPANKQTLLSAATAATVWRLQHPTKPFEALTSGIYTAFYGAL